MTRSETVDGPLNYHDEYYSINTGVHRKGGVELVTPTLTHHLGLWYPPQRSVQGAHLAVQKFGYQIDVYVGVLFSALRGLDHFESNFTFTIGSDEIVCLFGDAYRVVRGGRLERFPVAAQTCHFGLKDAQESDNRILFMKARWHGLSVIVRCEFRSEYATIARFVTLENETDLHPRIAGLRGALALLQKLGRGETCAEASIASSHGVLYHELWDALDTELFHCADLFRAGGTTRSRVFADFRGLVVAGSDAAGGGTISLDSIKASKDRGRPFVDGWSSERLIPSIWPFLTARNGLDLKRREFTASLMLDKRAVYVTALGPQPSADDGLRCAPLYYFLVARPVSDWQLGALVDRLHFMGTVRLAALMEMKALREAGANLRDMENEAEAARRAIDENDTARAVRHYQQAMKLIEHKSKAGQPLFMAGLQFRVERSRFYVQRFDELVPFLGIDPIEGYQRYDYFVKGRLGGVFDYIDRLGRRQERAVVSAESICQLISVKEASETNRQIAEANEQSAIANAQSAEANKQNSRISRTIEKLQTKAEIALLAVIVPHYLIGIVKDIHEVRESAAMVHAFWAILLVGIMLALTSLGAYIKDRADERAFDQIKAMSVKYGLLFFFAVAVFVVTFHLDG